MPAVHRPLDVCGPQTAFVVGQAADPHVVIDGQAGQLQLALALDQHRRRHDFRYVELQDVDGRPHHAQRDRQRVHVGALRRPGLADERDDVQQQHHARGRAQEDDEKQDELAHRVSCCQISIATILRIIA